MKQDIMHNVLLEEPLEDIKQGLTAGESKEKLIYSGRSFCPSCERVIKANLISRDNFIYIVKECHFEHKVFENLIQKISPNELNEIKTKIPAHWPVITKKLPLGYIRKTNNHSEELGVKNIKNLVFAVLLLTNRCNLGCKICFQKTAHFRKDMELAQIKQIVKNFKKMLIVLFGGEPTLRDDLPEIISLVKKSGNFPILFTNGLKLSDRKYLAKLKKAGLKTVFFTLDSLSYNPEAVIRGINEHCYEKKIKALENLIADKFNIRINATILKGINENQVPLFIKYASDHPEISELFFRPLCLTGNEEWNGFNKSHLLSPSEIMNSACRYLQIDEDYFFAWDKFKWAIVNYLSDKSTLLKLPQFSPGQIYLKREKNGFVPLFDLGIMRDLTEALENNKIYNKLYKIAKPKNIGYILELFKRIAARSASMESSDFMKTVLRISVRPLIGESLYMLPGSESIVDNLKYFSDGKVSVGFNNSLPRPGMGVFFE